MIDLSVFRRRIDLVLHHHGIADERMVDDIMQIVMQVAIAAALENAEPVYRTKAGTLLTEEVIQELVDEAEQGYDVSHLKPRPPRSVDSFFGVVAKEAVRSDHGIDDEVGTYEVDTPKRVLTRNAVRCHKCGEVIESLHRHDFRRCSCGSVAVDGGLDYTKRSTVEGATFTEMSEWA